MRESKTSDVSTIQTQKYGRFMAFNILHTILRNLLRNSCCLSCVVPGKQCLYQGLTMFDQAMWSPTSCVTCLCTGGQVVCEEVSCPTMHCYFPFTPAGECCPICMESGKTPMGTRVKEGTTTDSSSYIWVSDHLCSRLALKLKQSRYVQL